MALLWQKKKNGVTYQVRTAGNSVRLYTNKVFHSQWNPNAVLSGAVWDLLLLPTFMLANPTSIKNVLVLGVGGGAVIKALSHCLQPNKITGVDLDATHLYIAKRFFGINSTVVRASNREHANNALECKLIHAEAKGWLEKSQTKYDLIIEDIFKEDIDGRPIRAVEATEEWLTLLTKKLANKGTLVMNFDSQSSWQKAKRIAKQNNLLSTGGVGNHVNCVGLALPQYENRMGVFSFSTLNKHLLPLNTEKFAGLSPRRLEKMGYGITQHKI